MQGREVPAPLQGACKCTSVLLRLRCGEMRAGSRHTASCCGRGPGGSAHACMLLVLLRPLQDVLSAIQDAPYSTSPKKAAANAKAATRDQVSRTLAGTAR